MESEPLLRCRNLSKSFKGVRALDGVDFEVHPGRVHGLIGENGAGKSTLMKIIAGAYSSDGGELFCGGQKVHFQSPQEAIDRKIISIYQDTDLIPTLSVAENIHLNREPTRTALRLIDRRRQRAETRRLLAEFGLQVDPLARVGELPHDLQKMVQIIKAVSKEARVLLMDEPSSSLTHNEVELLLGFVKSLAGRGVGVVFVSHYLAEVFRVCDDITILREGRVVSKVQTASSSLPQAIRLMIGRSMAEEIPSAPAPCGRELFAARELRLKRKLKGVSFAVHEGEVLGITGLMGSGATELAKAIFGSEDARCDTGHFYLRGEPVRIRSTAEAIRHGIAYLPNDRKNEGLFAKFTVADNVCIASIDRFRTSLGLLDKALMARQTRVHIERLAVKTPDQATPIENLSGGNQQKVLLAKWLETRPRLLILDEPTVGIDIGTKYEIRRIIRDIAGRGVSIILITSEIEELEKLCQRVLVMFRGRIARELQSGQIRKEAILRASMGE